VRQVLESVRADGLLISAEVYTQLLAPSGRPVATGDPPVVAVITWERPDALARCLDSLAENCDLSAVARIVVVDDSDTDTVISRNRQTAKALAARSPVPVQYVGAIEQAAFIERMVKQSPSLEAAIRMLASRERWAGHWTSGLARNMALLLSTGERLLVLDDDIVCETFDPEHRRSGVSFGDRPREYLHYGSPGDWQHLRAEQDTDPLARHARILGQGLGDALGAQGIRGLTPACFEGAEVAFLEGLDERSPVLLTECGSLGDPGTDANNWLTGLEGESLERLLHDADSVSGALNHRNCWLGRGAVHVSMRGNMSQLTGLDNRRLLPPYFPIMRGEDRLFGNLLAFLHPHGVTIDQPFSIAHLPIPPRQWSGKDNDYRLPGNFPGFFLEDLVERPIETPLREPLQRLGLVARRFEELAAMNHAEVLEHALDRRLDNMSRAYCRLKAMQAPNEGAPQPWRDFVDRAVSALNRALVETEAAAGLSGYPADLRGEALTAWWRDSWSQFAQALRVWPAVR